MNYLNLEQTLNRISGYGIIDGPFYGLSGALESILKDEKLKPAEKADKLSELLKDSWEAQQVKVAKAEGKVDFLTPEEYGEIIGKSSQMVRRYIREGRIPAYIFGKGNNRKLIIPNHLPGKYSENS